jgi:hypothetical protein
MGLLDKAKQAAEQAAAKAKEGVEDVQTKRELGQAYGDLGRAAFELVESGELSHARLEEPSARIRSLSEKLAVAGATSNGAEGAADHDASQPPAMPT